MSLIVLFAHHKKDDYRVYPLKDGKPILVGVMTLQKTSKGFRPLKVRVVKDKEDEYLPLPTFVELLKAADSIFTIKLTGEREEEINDMLKAYQRSSTPEKVCRFCMMEDRITFLGEEVVRYKGELICFPCALKELKKEAAFHGRQTKAGMDRLESLLKKTGDLNRVMTLFTPKNLPAELTRYDTIEVSSHNIRPIKVQDLKVDDRLKNVLLEKMQELLPVQSKSVSSGLLDGKTQLVVSATATGKTLIGELAGIDRALKGKGSMLFLVPLVALANQKYEQFKARYGPVGLRTSIRIGTSRIALNTVKLNTSLESDIIVGTYEGIDYILRMGQQGKFKKIGTVVIDEVHMLEDPERGHRLDGMIARLKACAPDAQFIFLSATIGNPKEVARKLKATLVEYEYRPVPLERHLIFAGAHEKNHLIDEYAQKEYAKVSSKGFKGQTIVFTNSRKKCHSISQSLRIQSAPYHAGLAYPKRKSVEERFAKGEIKVVVTTAALAAGVDFPASQVIFETLAMGNSWLRVGEFQQMQGRAGRPDYHDKGQVIVLSDPEMSLQGGDTEEEIAFRLLKGSVEHVNVEYEDNEQLEECLANMSMASTEKEIGRINEDTLGIESDAKSLIDRCVREGLALKESGKVKLTPMGKAIVTHFLSLEDAFLIRERVQKKAAPMDIAIELEPFDAVYFRGAERMSRVIGINIPSRVFSPSSLDIVFSGDAMAKMDRSMQSQFRDFTIDFLSCECEDTPFCGCPERKFSAKVIEYRLQGKDPSGISKAIAADYGLNTFDGDILGWLDRLTRSLDAIYEIAGILGKKDMSHQAREMREKIENAE